MAKISEETVRHIAKLSRLGLSEKEVKKFSGQLSSVFEYMDVLKEVDTDGVMETSQVTGLQNVSGKDEIKKWGVVDGGASGVVSTEVSREDLLKCTELPVESNQILVKSVIKK